MTSRLAGQHSDHWATTIAGIVLLSLSVNLMSLMAQKKQWHTTSGWFEGSNLGEFPSPQYQGTFEDGIRDSNPALMHALDKNVLECVIGVG